MYKRIKLQKPIETGRQIMSNVILRETRIYFSKKIEGKGGTNRPNIGNGEIC